MYSSLLRENKHAPSGFLLIKIKDESMISKPIYPGKEFAEQSGIFCRKALPFLLHTYIY